MSTHREPQDAATEADENMAAWDVVEALSADPLPIDSVAFTVPEGLTVAEVPEAIVADIPSFTTEELAGLIAGGTIRPALLDPANPNLEGFLFPDTYELLAGQGPDAALQRMAQQFDAGHQRIVFKGRGLMSPSVNPSAHLIASKYICATSRLSHVAASWPSDE